jgi:hypothetical protein
MGLAAAALVVVTASATYLLTAYSLRPAAAPNVASVAPSEKPVAPAQATAEIPILESPPESVPLALDSADIGPPGAAPLAPPAEQVPAAVVASQESPAPADPVYEREVVRLQTIMSWRKAQLSPSTAAIIDHNLRIIDDAIAQSNEALQTDPASPMLRDQLAHALAKKVGLLRRAAMLGPST